MAQMRGNQRGVVKVVSTLLLAGVGALLSVAGCAADDGRGGPSVTEENVGSQQQAISCNKLTPCPVDSCTQWTCSAATSMCVVVKQLLDDGTECIDADKNPGICAAGVCCTGGCAAKNKLTGWECRRGTEVSACGLGKICENCSKGDQCTTYSCNTKRECDSAAIKDGQVCASDPGVCSGGKCCTGCFDGGVCQPGNTPKQCGIGGAEKCQSCDDSNPCTDDSCDANGKCVYTPVEAGKSCDTDTNLCNGTAKCDGTVCKTAPAKNCDDGNVCTTDSCTPATGVCVYTNNTLGCSDGDVCTQVDKCSGGACVGSSPANCNDNEECTTDTCDKTLGCQHKAVTDNTTCNDGNDCSTGDRCLGGKCQATGGKDCNDGKSCTKDACSANVCGPIPEDNGTPCVLDRCHVNSACQLGECTGGDLINCDDANPCTTDSCDAATGCKHVANDAATCSDGDLCTIEDKCSAGKCVGKEMTCTPIDDCHLGGTCNVKTGTCDDPRAPDDTECNNGKGKCVTGKCDVPVTGEGGAGGEGAGGEGTAGTTTQGGEPATGNAGDGNAPTTGGENGTGGTSTSGGTSNTGATTSTGEGGEDAVPRRPFTRDPGGCSCNLPGSSSSSHLGWLGGLSLAALVLGRRRVRNNDRRAA